MSMAWPTRGILALLRRPTGVGAPTETSGRKDAPCFVFFESLGRRINTYGLGNIFISVSLKEFYQTSINFAY